MTRVLVVTVVHRPDDARILHRQIATLQDAGFSVTYAAPFTATGVAVPSGLVVHDLPQAVGRRRLAALVAARRFLRAVADDHDLVLLHDPELLLAVRAAGVGTLPPVVWDVHEDTAVALGDRDWIPAVLRGLLRRAVRRLERWAERNVHLILAEDGYRPRFRRSHPVIRNYPWAVALGRTASEVGHGEATTPRPPHRVVYVGRISRGRGIATILALARRLGPDHQVELAGPVDGTVRSDVDASVADGTVVWHGFVPNDRVGGLLDGALAGLSLLSDDPNYRVSMPSKVIEYLAHGVPVVATPLPAVAALLGEEGGGLLVPFDDVDAAVAAVLRLTDEPGLHARLVEEGRAAAAGRAWEAEGARLASTLRGWARSAPPVPPVRPDEQPVERPEPR
jgi:glycosyltransferase involved in cell wall biosynthesis